MAFYFNPRGANWISPSDLRDIDHRRTNVRGLARPKWIAGRELCGFWGMFEESYGDPSTESPMYTVTPSSVGNSLLPFRCPRCKRPAQELACPETRKHYADPRPGRDGVHRCPSCNCRMKIDLTGTPLPTNLRAGALVAPSKIERAGKAWWQDKSRLEGDYAALAKR